MAGFTGQAARAVVVRPGLWPTVLRQAGRLARPGWWRRAPFLPLPDPDYLAFRLETQYGGADPGDRTMRAVDLVTYLEWCREQDRVIRAHRRAMPPSGPPVQ